MAFPLFGGPALRGGRIGAASWSAYGIAELALLGPLSWLAVPSHLYRPIHWGTVVLAGAAYPIVGFGIAALAGGSRARWGPPTSRAVATLALVATADACVVADFGMRRPALVTVLVSALAVLGLAVVSARRRIGPSASSLALGLLLTGTVWIHREAPAAGLFQNLHLALPIMVAIAALGAGSVRAQGTHYDPRMTAGLHVVAWALLAALCAFLQPAPFVATSAPRLPLPSAPSIVLITMDTVRADHLSLYGYGRSTTPHLQDLATGSTVYTNALATGDMTLSSHASLFTGRYAFAHGARPPAQPLPENARTLAEMLAERGYRTAAVVANTVYLRAVLGLAQGFQYYDQRIPARLAGGTPRGYLSDIVGRAVERVIPDALRPHYRQGNEITDEALRLLDGTRRHGGPLFLFVNYMDAHTPYLPPPPFDTRFPGKDPAWAWASHRALKRQMVEAPSPIPPGVRAHLVSQYDAGIAFVDAEIGRVVARLKELGLFEDSLVIVTSDHGEAFGEHDLIEHGVSVYQDQVHVPLLIKLPRSREAKVVRDWVSGVDVLPTILEVIGAAPEPQVQGRSLLRPTATRAVLCESFQAAQTIRGFVTPRGIKLILGEGLPSRMYDLLADPEERVDLGRSAPERLAGLVAEMTRLMETEGHLEAGPQGLDEGTLEELRALGYAH